MVNRERGLRPAQAVGRGGGRAAPPPSGPPARGDRAAMTTAVVDVMLPHYGRLDLVQETVRSVLAQDDPNWRLTVVDDSGELPDDGLGDWCAGLGDPRVRYLRNRRNLGINRNFQRCVTLVEHELAVIIGSDDLMLPGYVGTVRRAHHGAPGGRPSSSPASRWSTSTARRPARLVDLSKRWVYAPRAVRADRARRGGAGGRACCAATGCTSRRSAGGPGRCGAPGSARGCRWCRTSPWCSTSCWTASRCWSPGPRVPLPAAPRVGLLRARGRRPPVRRGAGVLRRDRGPDGGPRLAAGRPGRAEPPLVAAQRADPAAVRGAAAGGPGCARWPGTRSAAGPAEPSGMTTTRARSAAVEPAARSPRRWPGRLLAVGVPTALVGGHALAYGRWIVDDAGITFAYARSSPPAPGRSCSRAPTPSRATRTRPGWPCWPRPGLGLFDRGAWFGVPDYVAFPKLLALVLVAGMFGVLRGRGRGAGPPPGAGDPGRRRAHRRGAVLRDLDDVRPGERVARADRGGDGRGARPGRPWPTACWRRPPRSAAGCWPRWPRSPARTV